MLSAARRLGDTGSVDHSATRARSRSPKQRLKVQNTAKVVITAGKTITVIVELNYEKEDPWKKGI